MSYIDGATLDEAREAIRQGCTVQSVAGQVGCSAEHLANLLGLPQWKQLPQQQASDEFDLFEGSERLQAQL